MKLESRLERLEAQLKAGGGSKSIYGKSRSLFEDLAALGAKLEGQTFSQEWCQMAAPREIAAAALLEAEQDVHTPELWQAVQSLSNAPGAVGKLFTSLGNMKDEGARI